MIKLQFISHIEDKYNSHIKYGHLKRKKTKNQKKNEQHE